MVGQGADVDQRGSGQRHGSTLPPPARTRETEKGDGDALSAKVSFR
jgi:hypothetical protein